MVGLACNSGSLCGVESTRRAEPSSAIGDDATGFHFLLDSPARPACSRRTAHSLLPGLGIPAVLALHHPPPLGAPPRLGLGLAQPRRALDEDRLAEAEHGASL